MIADFGRGSPPRPLGGPSFFWPYKRAIDHVQWMVSFADTGLMKMLGAQLRETFSSAFCSTARSVVRMDGRSAHGRRAPCLNRCLTSALLPRRVMVEDEVVCWRDGEGVGWGGTKRRAQFQWQSAGSI